MSAEIRLTRAAIRDLDGLDRTTERRVRETLAHYAETGTGDVRKLSGRGNEWRLRVGDYRILFARGETENILLVRGIRHRREAYRG